MIALLTLIILLGIFTIALACAISWARHEKPISATAAKYTLLYVLAVFAVGLVIFYMIYGQLPLQRELLGRMPHNNSNPTT